MRVIYILVLSLGLVLVITSLIDILQVHHYLAVVERVQAEVSDRNKQIIELLRTYNHDIMFLPSTESILSSLDGADDLETGWWVVFGIGCVFSLAGFAGVTYCNFQARRQAADAVIRTGARNI
jgi:hypothetical protein